MAFGSSVHEALTWVWPPAVLALVVWMLRRARQELHTPVGRRLLLGALAVLALASVAGGVETVRAAADATRPPPGRLIDVGGHRLHLSCTGSGGPTVVLEPGAGLDASDVGLIASGVARDTRVCAYDRAGRGWSDPAEAPQDATQIATDLRTLLHRGQVPGPYVLAGHSFGGLYALTFAARHPGEVAGIVLVDSTAPAAGTASPAGTAGDLPDRVAALAAAAARLGLGRVVGAPTPSYVESIVDEYAQGGASAEQAASLRDLADTPLVVLTAGVGQRDGWGPAQAALATLSSSSVHRVVEGVDHGGLIGDDDGAAATTRAILDVVASLRSGRPLPG